LSLDDAIKLLPFFEEIALIKPSLEILNIAVNFFN
jgi:hypothetical protein